MNYSITLDSDVSERNYATGSGYSPESRYATNEARHGCAHLPLAEQTKMDTMLSYLSHS